jgi:hypothetical protein
MTDQHPISVPQELLNQWCRWKPEQTPEGLWRKIADNAAQWGSDQELEACCEYIANEGEWFADSHFRLKELRAARRPKPLSLKEQALALLEYKEYGSAKTGVEYRLTKDDAETLRRALEQLND